MSHHAHHHHTTPKILFILKRRDKGAYGSWNYSCEGGDMSSGLKNSVVFMLGMLARHNIEASMVTVQDNNQIDREVTLYRPTHVFIEAFWVVAEKFDVLKRLHPSVKWIVRNHSKTEFLSNETHAFGRALAYMNREVEVASNSLEGYYDMTVLTRSEGIESKYATYLPNYYPVTKDFKGSISRHHRHHNVVNVGCFGAIRPLKNTMVQAIAAINFADKHGQKLRFHINGTRTEGRGEAITANLRTLFGELARHELVEHEWMEHEAFLQVLKGMDMLLQVSFSETFNIVAADAVTMHVPIIVSPEIPWAHKISVAEPNESVSITKLMGVIFTEGDFHAKRRLSVQKSFLHQYSERTEKVWLKHLGVLKD